MSVSSQARILALRRLLAKHPSTNVFQKQVQQIRYNVLGQLPQLNMRTGHQKSKRQLKGVYYTQYYLDSMEQAARKVRELKHTPTGTVLSLSRKARCGPHLIHVIGSLSLSLRPFQDIKVNMKNARRKNYFS